MNKRFIVIGRSTCPFCVMAEDLLKASNIETIFLDYATRVQLLEEYKQFHKQKTVPIILANDLSTGLVEKVGGYTDLLEYLGE